MKLKIQELIPTKKTINKFVIHADYELDTGNSYVDEIYADTEGEAIETIKALRTDVGDYWSTVESTSNERIKESLEYILEEMGIANELRLTSLTVKWINEFGLEQNVLIEE